MKQLIQWIGILAALFGIYVGIFYYNGNFHNPTVVDLIKVQGYQFEIHSNLTTQDGYLLEMYRIRNNDKLIKNKPAVLLMHGLLTSSYCFLEKKNFLGYVLADNGFDVWIGNARGTVYSRKHVNLTENNKEYWNFSWHEIGLYDVRTFIDYVVNETKQESIYYVGHSQGTTVYYVLASLYPEINLRIKHMVALAPIIYFNKNPNWLIQIGVVLQNVLKAVLSIIGINSIAPPNNLIPFGSEFICNSMLMTPVCWLLLQLNDYNFATFNERVDISYANYVTAIMQGCSVRQFYHYGQLIQTNEFCQYDFGKEINLIKYNSTNPPRYNLDRFNTTMSIYYSNIDHYGVNIERMKSSFKNVTRIKEVPFKHLDYVTGKDRMLLYKDILEDLTKYIST